MALDNERLWELRKARARRWTAAGETRGYPALAAEDETEETLAAKPPKREEKRPKPNHE